MKLFTSMFLPGGTPEEIDSFNRLQQLSATAEEAARMVRGYADIDVQAQASKVSCPTLVMHAHDDARVPFEEGRLVASLIPGARFVPLASRNHVVLARARMGNAHGRTARVLAQLRRAGRGKGISDAHAT